MPDPKKPITNVNGVGLASINKMKSQEELRKKLEAMTPEERSAYHESEAEKKKENAQERIDRFKNDPAMQSRAEYAADELARLEQEKNRKEVYKKQYGVDPMNEDLELLNRRGFFRIDFMDEGFKHGEVYSGEEDTKRRRQEYYSGKRVDGTHSFLKYSQKVRELGKQILANAKANGQQN